jgi:hypothetical protein
VDKQIQLDKATVGDARYTEVHIVGWKRNGDARVAPKGRTRYFLFQPSLPLSQATLVRGAFVLIARVRPALLSFPGSCLGLYARFPMPPAVGYLRQDLTNAFDVLGAPQANANATHLLEARSRNFLSQHIPLKRDVVDAKSSRCLAC